MVYLFHGYYLEGSFLMAFISFMVAGDFTCTHPLDGDLSRLRGGCCYITVATINYGII